MTALAAERARHDATAFDWSDTPEAQTLIARYLKIDDLYQTIAGQVSADVDQGFYDELVSIECDLDFLRDRRIDDEIAGLSEADQEDDYLIEQIEASAPTVTTMIDLARKVARAAERIAA